MERWLSTASTTPVACQPMPYTACRRGRGGAARRGSDHRLWLPLNAAKDILSETISSNRRRSASSTGSSRRSRRSRERTRSCPSDSSPAERRSPKPMPSRSSNEARWVQASSRLRQPRRFFRHRAGLVRAVRRSPPRAGGGAAHSPRAAVAAAARPAEARAAGAIVSTMPRARPSEADALAMPVEELALPAPGNADTDSDAAVERRHPLAGKPACSLGEAIRCSSFGQLYRDRKSANRSATYVCRAIIYVSDGRGV